MRFLTVLCLTLVVTASFVGCGSNATTESPTVPTSDNRPEEIKEVDDAMQKSMQEKMKNRR